MDTGLTDMANALVAIPTTLMWDWPSIIAYWGISYGGEMIHELTQKIVGTNAMATHWANGINDTLRQDYLINYLGIGGAAPPSHK